MLTKALGDDKASNLISRILQGGDTNGIEGLKWMDAPTVADLIRNEQTGEVVRYTCRSEQSLSALEGSLPVVAADLAVH